MCSRSDLNSPNPRVALSAIHYLASKPRSGGQCICCIHMLVPSMMMVWYSNDGLCKAKVHVCMMTLPIALPPPDQYHSSHLKIVLIGCELSMRH
jgi:hypothetical protein